MHEHDFDLIAQLAEGSLVGDDVQSARRTLVSCEDCRQEFEAQTLALQAFSDVERARLTDFERVKLHRAVAEATATPARRPRARAMWLPRLAVAAVAVAFVGMVGVGLTNLGGDDVGDMAAQAPQPEAVTAEDAASVSAAQEPVEESSAAASQTEGASELQPSAFASPVLPLNLGVIDRDAVDALTFERPAPGAVPERTTNQTPLEPFPFACVGAAVGTYGEETELRLAGVAVFDGQPVEVLGFGDQLFLFDPKTCDLVFDSGTP